MSTHLFGSLIFVSLSCLVWATAYTFCRNSALLIYRDRVDRCFDIMFLILSSIWITWIVLALCGVAVWPDQVLTR